MKLCTNVVEDILNQTFPASYGKGPCTRERLLGGLQCGDEFGKFLLFTSERENKNGEEMHQP